MGYEVCLVNNDVVGVFGTWLDLKNKRGHLSWIMIDPSAHGMGIGTAMMGCVLEILNPDKVQVIDIAASQKSAPFFTRFGAVEKSRTTEGWGPGLDRVEMELIPGGSV